MYYDQFTYINGILYQSLALATGVIIVVMQLFSGLRLTFIVAFCALLTCIEILGVMWMLNIILGSYPVEMNAVLVVNLVTSLGLAFEFCSHIAMSFSEKEGSRQQRAMKALHEVGSAVVVGIVANKLIAILMLAFAQSTLFRLYYFRMYLVIILIGAFNGLFVLPILLSWIGPPTVSKINHLRTSINSILSMCRTKYWSSSGKTMTTEC